MSKKQNDITWTLITLKISGEAQSNELDALHKLIENEPAWKAKLSLLDIWWNNNTAKPEPCPNDFFEKLQGKIQAI